MTPHKVGDTTVIAGVSYTYQMVNGQVIPVPTDSIQKTYRLGAAPGLPQGSIYASTSQDKVWDNLVNGVPGQAQGLGIAAATNLVRQWSGDPTLTAEQARTKLSGWLNTYGTVSTGVGGVYQGLMDSGELGRGTGSGSGSGSGTSGANILANEQSAFGQVKDVLKQYGLEGQLSDWAWQTLVNANGQMSATDVVNAMQDTQAFKDRFPAMAMRTANGYNPITVTDYLNFEDTMNSLASSYGLPKGAITKDAINQLISGNVSVDEMKSRFNTAYAAVQNADANTKTMLNQYYGINDGSLVSYWLDPKHTSNLLQQQIASSAIGGAALGSGFGATNRNVAEEMQKQGITTAEARAGFEKIAPMQSMEQAQVGQAGQATVTRQQLIGSQFGSMDKTLGLDPAQVQAQLQRTQEARAAGLEGGGQYAADAKGVVGLGSASTSGTGRA